MSSSNLHTRPPSLNMPTETAPLNTSEQDDSDQLEGKEQNQSFHTRSRHCNSFWLDTWRFEIIVLLFSIACFVAICIVLLIFQNKVRPEMAYDLSLNAIVSVLATGCKSALILVVGEAICQLKWLHFGNAKHRKLSDIQEFEEASRGPLGSLTILVRHRANSLVSIGAAVVVLMLAFEPFMQQLVSYPVWPVEIPNGEATIKRLHNFAYGVGEPSSISQEDTLEDSTKWKNAFARGIWLDGSFDTQPICSSGDCSWETFSSLGICSRCWDLTSSAQLKCELPRSTVASNGSCQIVMPDADMIGHTFEVELVHLISTPAAQEYISLSFPTSMVWTAFDYSEPDSNMDFPNITTFDGMVSPLVAYAYAQIEMNTTRSASSSASGSDLISIKNMTMCSQGSCLRDYDISMQNGQTSIQTANIDFGTQESITEGIICWAPKNKSKAAFTTCGGLDMVPVSSLGFFPIKSTALFKNETGQWTHESVTDDDDDDDDDDDESPIMNRMESVGFEKMISNIAASFTQLSLELSNDTFNGTVHGSEVFVSVQWYWLILPTLLMVTGTTFFAVTVLVNRRAKMPLWKSSALAPFFHGLDQVGEGHFISTSEMEKTAKRVEVQLKDAEGYGRLMLREKTD